jgi:predicted PurR-regulated permease PerM
LTKLLPGRLETTETNVFPASAVVVTNAETGTVVTNAPLPGSTAYEAQAFWNDLFGKETFKSAADWFAKTAPKIGAWALNQVSRVASFFGLLAGLALVPIYAFYFLLEKRGIESHWSDYLPVTQSGFKDELIFVIKAINEHLIAFFRGQVLVAICDGICYTIGFLLIGLPYAVLLGVMATFLTMIPFLGAIATCAAALVIAFVQFGDWQHPLLVLAVFAVVQSLEGFVIQPKIMGDRTGLHPLTIIIAVMVGTTVLGGILGGILAIPLTAAGKVLMLRYVWKKRET